MGCNASSGDDYDPTTYGVVAGTDAAGLPQYLTLRLDEIKNNAIHHPSRFTLARGYIQSADSGTPNLWPATGTNGWGSPSALPFGARLRLNPDYDVTGKSGYAQKDPQFIQAIRTDARGHWNHRRDPDRH